MWEEEIFFKLPRVYCSDTLWVENFDEIPLSHTVKEIEAILCFAIFGKENFFENCQEYIGQIPCCLIISTKSLYLARLRRYKQIRVLPFLAKIQNGRHFWGGEIFLKIAKSAFLK